jgi:hypothetical protein
VTGQLRTEHGEAIAGAQNVAERLHILMRARCAKLDANPAALLGVGTFQQSGDAARDAVLKHTRLMFGFVAVAGGQRELDLLGVNLGILWHQSVGDPEPHRLKRRTRDPTAMLVIGNKLRRSSASTISAPAGAVPTNRPRSSSEISNARAPGLQIPEIGAQSLCGMVVLAGHSGTTHTIIRRI